MKIWWVIILLGTLTHLGRSSFILWFSHWELPAWLQKALKFVPVAAFAAILTPAILRPDGTTLAISLMNPRLLAAGVTVLLAWNGRHLIITITTGMIILWLSTWLINL